MSLRGRIGCVDGHSYQQSIYMYQDSKLLAYVVLIQLKLEYGSFWQSNMHSTLDFCSDQPRRKQIRNYIRYAKSLPFYCIYCDYHCLQSSTLKSLMWLPSHIPLGKSYCRVVPAGLRSCKFDNSKDWHTLLNLVVCRVFVLLMSNSVLKYYSTTVTHDKNFVYNFCVL